MAGKQGYILIEPKGLLDRFEKHLGVDEIEFESDEFNEHFRGHLVILSKAAPL
jgi:hypothetical protein